MIQKQICQEQQSLISSCYYKESRSQIYGGCMVCDKNSDLFWIILFGKRVMLVNQSDYI